MAQSITIGKNISFLLKKYNLSEADLAKVANIPRATINRLTLGKTPDPRISTLQSIAEYFGVSVNQLLGKENINNIPIVEMEELHQPNIINKKQHADYFSDINHPINEHLFATKVNGDAMFPQFVENTVLIVDPKKIPKNRDFVIAKINTLKNVIFRQLILDGDCRLLKPINSLFNPLHMEGDDQIIGVVVQTRNNY